MTQTELLAKGITKMGLDVPMVMQQKLLAY